MIIQMTINIKNLIIFFCLFSCNQAETKKIAEKRQFVSASEIVEDTTKVSFEIRKLRDGVYFETVRISDTSYVLKWGIESTHSYFSKHFFAILGNGTLEYLTSNDSVIILSQTCGTSCSYFVILPMNGHEPLLYYHPQALDLNRNLIAYSPTKYDEDIFLIVENYLTGKQTLLKENNLCPGVFKGDCIEACFFEGSELILKWQGSQWDGNNQKDIQIKRILINDA